LDTITSLILLMLTVPSLSDQLQADAAVFSNQCHCCYTGLNSYRGPRQNSKTWVQVTRRRQPS